jgi:adenylate cyclase
MEQDVSFGRHRFDLETGRLWSGKREVKLTPKASAVLKALVMHAGQPVRKEELFASVWTGTVVSDDALTSCIQELRRALADDAKRPHFIETRHRRGYQFVARVSKRAGEGPVQSKPSIAVLPFANMSGEPEQEYFSDGITEDIITDLSKVSTLNVLSRNTTFTFKGKAVDIGQIAQRLKIDTSSKAACARLAGGCGSRHS